MADSTKIKDSLNLPKTPFSMKAKLAQKEPEILEKWDKIDLYGKIQEERKEGDLFVLHDGPPYANGNIHLGTAMNKILKDFIIKSKTMAGFRAPYIPGWDCHGLPIEIKVDQLLKAEKKDLSVLEIRDECKKYAMKYVGIQRSQFQRLGVLGRWMDPYLTMNPGYEAEILRYLAAFFDAGNVYKGKKPVYWCISCRTALAEAEIEYKDHRSPSIYVKFPMISDLGKKYPKLKGRKVSILIWTTTPWTLPANLAIAFHPDFEYAAFVSGGEVLIAAKRLVPVIAEALELESYEILAEFSGKEMEGLKAQHPFIQRESLLVLADYVTLDQGTGCVHSAPGHGHEDYLTGLNYGLDIYTPVDSHGRFTSQVDKYSGMNVFDANKLIMEDLISEGLLVRTEDLVHSYPHCWRCKNPVIYRATAQWFIAMDHADLRAKTLDEIKRTRWIPSWGEERITNMMEARPDWCISRQRSWGVPIPAFYCHDCGTILANGAVTRRVADIFQKEGSNAWYQKKAEDLLPEGISCDKCGGSNFNKENNILDVWFESGASHNVLERNALSWPADVYIEGHDQYRGWFNSSMLVGMGAKKGSPYKTCITHGFVLDEQGRGMSKSLGNYIEPEEIINQNGAEILRLWVAMLNYKEDARYGSETKQRLVEAYRKIRNTWRFLLGNVFDFDPDRDSVADAEMAVFDRWALEKFRRFGRKLLRAYDEYEYHTVFHSVYNFFTVQLSAYYLDVLKDRLYCSAEKSTLRRSAQTVLFEILRSTLILVAPILPFTTEEAWEAMPDYRGKKESVHLSLFPTLDKERMEGSEFKEWEDLGMMRDLVLKEMEVAREAKTIGNSLEAAVTLKVPQAQFDLLTKHSGDLASLFIVSQVDIELRKGDETEIFVSKAAGGKCERCWNISTSVGADADHPEFCNRCAAVLEEMGL